MLANELLASRVVQRVGLPVPITEVIEVSSWLIENTADLCSARGQPAFHVKHGLALAARFVIERLEGPAFNYLPASALDRVPNLNAFAGMLAFDKWTCNTNGRQAVFWKKTQE